MFLQSRQRSLNDFARDAAVVMIGYDPPDNEDEPLFSPELSACVNEFRNVLLVSSGGGVSLVA